MKKEAYATVFQHLSDMKKEIGEEIGLTDWWEIKQADINTFARLTQDEQWIHVAEEKSKAHSPYGQTVAHGFFILSLASKFAYEIYQVKDVSMAVNYGLDKVRFPNATLSGAFIRARATIVSFEEKPQGAKIKLGMTFEIKDQIKPACFAELIVQCYVEE